MLMRNPEDRPRWGRCRAPGLFGGGFVPSVIKARWATSTRKNKYLWRCLQEKERERKKIVMSLPNFLQSFPAATFSWISNPRIFASSFKATSYGALFRFFQMVLRVGTWQANWWSLEQQLYLVGTFLDDFLRCITSIMSDHIFHGEWLVASNILHMLELKS